MNEHIVKIMARVGTMWTHPMNDHPVECSWCIFNPSGITSHSHSIPLGVLKTTIDIGLIQEYRIVAILQIQCDKDS